MSFSSKPWKDISRAGLCKQGKVSEKKLKYSPESEVNFEG
jgi:hypothetical protein